VALGFASFVSDDSLAIGSHDIQVTQASAAASKIGSTLAASTLVDGTNDTLNISVNGVAKVLTIAHGTYTREQFAAAVQDAADAAGAAVAVSVDSATNGLTLATTREGSLASLQVTGGNALAALGLTTDGSPLTGTDGKVQVGTQPEQTFTSIEPGNALVLNAAVGTITATAAGGLRVGTMTAKNVATGDGSLATVVANINAANAGVTATAVLVGANTYRLQITSNTAGANNGANISDAEFDAGIGGFIELTAASDAQITVGDGVGAYSVTSETNTVSGLLPGVTVTLKKESDDPVTITASRDVAALAGKVEALVDAANAAKKAIDVLTKYDPETKKASILTGDAAARRIVSDLSRAITDAVPWATPGSPGLAGVSINRDGEYVFDAAAFTTKFNEDPEGVTRVFTQGGTASSSFVTFVSAGDRARAGSYAVDITQAATQASNVGLEGSWPIGSPPTVRVRVGSKIVSYEVGATDTQQNVVDALNTRFANEGLTLSASVSGTGIEVRSASYGTQGTFDVAWDGSTYNTYSGVNVAGTINGEAATGSGRQLSMAFSHPELGGLALEITATSAGSLGTFDYQPGVGQRGVTSLLRATDVVNGYVTSTENAQRNPVTFIDDKVASMERRLEQYETRLKRQFSQLDAVMGTLAQQGQWLQGQIASLSGSG
jgi:flagellar hook-associated protein 2